MTPRIHLGELTLTSPTFGHGDALPVRYTSAGAGVSPPLQWSGAAPSTKSFALIVHDPDAPVTHGFAHWVLYELAPDTTGLEEGSDGGAVRGINDLGTPDWVAADPPPGHGTHFYYFELYALDAALQLEPGLGRAALLQAIDDHIIHQARLVGTHRTEA